MGTHQKHLSIELLYWMKILFFITFIFRLHLNHERIVISRKPPYVETAVPIRSERLWSHTYVLPAGAGKLVRESTKDVPVSPTLIVN